MDRLKFIELKYLAIVSFLFFYASGYGQQAMVKQVSSLEFIKLVADSQGALLDVRTQGEYKNGHIKKSGQLNYYALDFKQKLLLLPKNQAIYLYCNTGYRSHRAAEFLIKNGYDKVYNLEHGIMEWNTQNFPVIVDHDVKPDLDNKYDLAQFKSLTSENAYVLVDFYAPWCAPCRTMMPMIDSLKVEYHGKINVVKVNADASKKLIKDLNIGGVPYMVLYRNNQIVFSNKGLITKQELINEFDNQLKNQ